MTSTMIRNGKRWTQEEESKLLTLAQESIPLDDISRQMERSFSAVRYRLLQLGLMKAKQEQWSDHVFLQIAEYTGIPLHIVQDHIDPNMKLHYHALRRRVESDESETDEASSEDYESDESEISEKQTKKRKCPYAPLKSSLCDEYECIEQEPDESIIRNSCKQALFTNGLEHQLGRMADAFDRMSTTFERLVTLLEKKA